MYVKIRNLAAKPGDKDLCLNLSKSTKIQDLRTEITKAWNLSPARQRLFYKGKLLVDDHALFDYDMQLNDVIQLMVSHQLPKTKRKTKFESEDVERKVVLLEETDVESEIYKIGDKVDVQDDAGSWSEAIIERIVNVSRPEEVRKQSEVVFKCLQDNISYPVRIDCTFDCVRPRAHYVYDAMKELRPGMTVLANYNADSPDERGFWYDFQITHFRKGSLKGTLFLGKDRTQLKNIIIKFVNEIYRIEQPFSGNKAPLDIPARRNCTLCEKCNDDASVTCDECGCRVCHAKTNVEFILLCDECDYGFHIGCLDPPLDAIPDDEEWYCPSCKVNPREIVNLGERLQISAKRANKPSSSNTQGNWGKGLSCVGRTKECTITKKDHLGAVPGVAVGTCWLYRQQVSEAGVHRPLVAGIHGSEKHYAYSIVLSGGYEDDIDNGDEFFYTGSGGRDLSGNKRVNEQSCDQKLTRMNKALAMSCNAKFNHEIGAEAKAEDWKQGKPIRVVRNYKAGKHSKYAPRVGNRYDGIYKVLKYYPEKGKSGFVIWRYLLRRDDETPAPWHEGGKEFDVIYPDGYWEAHSHTKKKGGKRVLVDATNTQTTKRMKISEFTIPDDLGKCIERDHVNEKWWEECKETLKDGMNKFYEKVQEVFMCICCQDVVYLPITTSCKHNLCKSCLQRSFASEIYSCPHCRFELGRNYDGKVNDHLRGALKIMFPHYEESR